MKYSMSARQELNQKSLKKTLERREIRALKSTMVNNKYRNYSQSDRLNDQVQEVERSQSKNVMLNENLNVKFKKKKDHAELCIGYRGFSLHWTLWFSYPHRGSL